MILIVSDFVLPLESSTVEVIFTIPEPFITLLLNVSALYVDVYKRQALDNAVILSDICKKVYLVHGGGSFKADDSLINDVLRRSNIVVLYHTEVSGLLSEDGAVTGLSLTDKTSGRKGVICLLYTSRCV